MSQPDKAIEYLKKQTQLIVYSAGEQSKQYATNTFLIGQLELRACRLRDAQKSCLKAKNLIQQPGVKQ